MNVLSRYYADLQILATMQLANASEPFWEPRAIKGREARVVVYLGCNVLRTVSLAEQFVRIVELIEGGPDRILVLGGPGHCCGSTHLGLRNDRAGAEKRGIRAVETFRSASPDLVIMWCPVCERRFGSYAGVELASEEFETVHASEYLARNIPRLRGIAGVKKRKLAIHEHLFDAASARDAASAVRALRQLPSLDFIESPKFTGYGYQCTAAEAEETGPEYAAALEAWLDLVSAAGADTVVSLYHGCHRAVVRGSRHRSDLRCISFLDPLAEWAGISVPDRYRRFVEIADEDVIWSEVHDRFAADAEPEVRRVIRKHFGRQAVRGQAGDPVQDRSA